MASQDEYQQQQFFKEKKWYPLNIPDIRVEIPMIWYADGRMEYDNSNVSNNWTISNENLKTK